MSPEDTDRIARMRVRILAAIGVAGLAASGCERAPDVVPVAREPVDAASPPAPTPAARGPATGTATTATAAPSATSAPSAAPEDAGASTARRGGRALANTIVVGGAICVPAAGTEGERSPATAGCGDHPGSQVWSAHAPLGCGPCAFTFDPTATARQRVAHPNACCYRGSSPSGPGRALRTANGLLPAPHARDDWMDRAAVRVDDPELRRAAHRAWLAAAALEHASVATFGRLSLELLALGAPADLVADAHAAALDEVRHARQSYAVAAAFGGAPAGPAALAAAVAPIAPPTLERIACEALVDGCFGEAVAALLARRGAETAEDGHVRGVLAAVAADEERHAELAWRTVAWAVREGGSRVTSALAGAIAAVDVAAPYSEDVDLSRYGFVTRAESQAVRVRVLEDLVRRCLDALVSST